ncbi:MAG TPA: hypothetical protein VFQ67_12165 [Allosphingosinicella sp.]|nr:hypothetical protein [Allosphingosinicella sp.]
MLASKVATVAISMSGISRLRRTITDTLRRQRGRGRFECVILVSAFTKKL